MNARFFGHFDRSSTPSAAAGVEAEPTTGSSVGSRRLVFALAVSALLLGACGGSPPEPVAELRLQEAQWRLPYPEWRTVTLAWTPRQELPTETPPWCFLHLKDDAGEIVRTFDHQPRGDWQVGEELSYELTLFQSVLAPGLPPGSYPVELGLYDPVTGDRWPLRIEGASNFEDLGRQAYRVAVVEVPQATPDAPRLTFSTGWTAPAAGTDKQILARRWLTGEGQLTVGDLDVPGSLWMRLRVPEPPTADALQILDDSAGDQPRLELTSTCTGRVHILDVPGVHQLVLPVYAATEPAGFPSSLSRAPAPGRTAGIGSAGVRGTRIGGEETVVGARRAGDLADAGLTPPPAGGATSCELQFWANYGIQVAPDQPPRSLALEALSWTAAQL